jgi:hypothetical protein
MHEFYASVVIWAATCGAFFIAASVGCAREPLDRCANLVCFKDSDCSFLVEPTYIQLLIHHIQEDERSSYTNSEAAVAAIQSLSRGMCAPGERMSWDADTVRTVHSNLCTKPRMIPRG